MSQFIQPEWETRRAGMRVLQVSVAIHERLGCKEPTPEGVCWDYRAKLLALVTHSMGYSPEMVERQVLPELQRLQEQHDERSREGGGS